MNFGNSSEKSKTHSGNGSFISLFKTKLLLVLNQISKELLLPEKPISIALLWNKCIKNDKVRRHNLKAFITFPFYAPSQHNSIYHTPTNAVRCKSPPLNHVSTSSSFLDLLVGCRDTYTTTKHRTNVCHDLQLYKECRNI